MILEWIVRKLVSTDIFFPSGVSLHLLASSIVRNGWFWVGLHHSTPPNSIWASRYTSSKFELLLNYHKFHWNLIVWNIGNSATKQPLSTLQRCISGLRWSFGGVLWWKPTSKEQARCGNPFSEPSQKRVIYFVTKYMIIVTNFLTVHLIAHSLIKPRIRNFICSPLK